MMDKAKGLHTHKPYYYNRELSWLKFNERVLDEAIDKEVPLCERLSFVSIFQSNLDEFFMVRVGTLTDQMIFSADARDNKTQMTAKEQLSEIFTSVGELLRKKDRAYLNLQMLFILKIILNIRLCRYFLRRLSEKSSRFHSCGIRKSTRLHC